MRETLYVHLRLPDGETALVGQAIRDAAAGKGWFKYAPGYLARAQAFALDPINLPLNDQITSFRYDKESPGLPGVLLDAGPDAWGRKLLSWYKKPPPTTAVQLLLAASGTGVGALRFTETKDRPGPDALFRPFASLQDMQRIARAVENGESADALGNELGTVFFDRGASLGGARPKTLVYDEGREWLAKMPRGNDPFNNPLAESVALSMAAAAGIDVPAHKLVSTGMGDVLLVERFDQRADGEQAHIISMFSLNNVFSVRDRREDDFSYDNLARMANRISKDNVSEAVFRRMVFNIACGNTDDHANNHALLKWGDERHFQLSPAFDLVPHPDLIGSHNLCVGPMGTAPSVDNIAGAARLMGIRPEVATSIVDQVRQATADWEDRYRDAGMKTSDIAQLGPCYTFGTGILQNYVERHGRDNLASLDLSEVSLSTSVNREVDAPQRTR